MRNTFNTFWTMYSYLIIRGKKLFECSEQYFLFNTCHQKQEKDSEYIHCYIVTLWLSNRLIELRLCQADSRCTIFQKSLRSSKYNIGKLSHLECVGEINLSYQPNSGEVTVSLCSGLPYDDRDASGVKKHQSILG